MTTKDYIFLANYFASHKPSKKFKEHYRQWSYMVIDMSKQLQGKSLRFDKQKFLDACQWEKLEK